MYEQLNMFGEKLVLRQLSMSNYNKIHGTYSIELKEGVNIIMPSKFNEYEIKVGLAIDEILDPDNQINDAKEFYYRNVLNIVLVLKGKKGFDDLNDMSYFPEKDEFSSEKDITVEGIFENQSLFISDIEGIKRKKKYREKEWFYRLREFKGKDAKARWYSYENVDEYTKENKKIMDGISIYPDELPVPYLSKFQFTKNFNFLAERYPKLDIKKLVEDINSILDRYDIGYEITGSLKNLSLKKLYQGRVLFDLESNLLELVIIIALEKQLRSSTVILSPNYLSSLYDESLELALEVLQEFALTEQQVLVLYNNVFYLTNHIYVREQAQLLNEMRKANNEKPCYNIVELTEKYKSFEEWKETTVKQSARRLCYMQDLDYDHKVALAKDIVKRAYRMVGAKLPAVGVSFGKDSMALFYLIHQVVTEENLPKPIVCFIDTGVEFPEHVYFAKEQAKVMEGMGYKVYWQKPDTTFWEVVKEYGFPIFGKAIRPSTHENLYKKLNELGIKYCGNTCCEKLKKLPYKELYDTLGIDLAFVGILASESNDRRQGYYRNYQLNVARNEVYNMYGEIYYVEGEGRYKCLPLVHFSEEDVWRFIKENDIPTSPLYSMGYWKDNKETGVEEFITYKRTGCWTCSMNIAHNGNNIEMLRHTHPHLWKLLMIKKGLAKELYKFKHNIPEDKWKDNADFINAQMLRYLEVKPCHLDIV
jgi:3'-phosphoadenosine 5'-phosphosulfate sulfotransferase (PAPS reductase)/FAD synthetase